MTITRKFSRDAEGIEVANSRSPDPRTLPDGRVAAPAFKVRLSAALVECRAGEAFYGDRATDRSRWLARRLPDGTSTTPCTADRASEPDVIAAVVRRGPRPACRLKGRVCADHRRGTRLAAGQYQIACRRQLRARPHHISGPAPGSCPCCARHCALQEGSRRPATGPDSDGRSSRTVREARHRRRHLDSERSR
jgi:hypothetical protein